MTVLKSSRFQDTAYSAEWRALTACVFPHAKLWYLDDPLRCRLNWSALIAQAQRHAMLPLLIVRLQQLAVSISPEIQTYLRSWERSQTIFTLTLTAELFLILERLANLDVGVLVTKGPALSVRCYGDVRMRQYGDLDLIVRDKDIKSIVEEMVKLGYESRLSLSAIHAAKSPGEYVVTNNDKRVHVEFHTEKTLRYNPKPLRIDGLFDRRSTVAIDGHKIPALSPEDELVLLCVHGAKHFWERLMWISDVAALICSQAPAWGRTAAIANEFGAERMLLLGLLLASDVLGAELPLDIEAMVRADRVVGKLGVQIQSQLACQEPQALGILQRAAFRFKSAGSFLQGLAYLLRLTLSPTEEDWTEGNQSRPALLEAIGRPLRLARKYGHFRS